MTPEGLRDCLDALAGTQRGLARLLGRPEGTVRQWLAGVVRVPADVAAWLDALARHHERHPPPAR